MWRAGGVHSKLWHVRRDADKNLGELLYSVSFQCLGDEIGGGVPHRESLRYGVADQSSYSEVGKAYSTPVCTGTGKDLTGVRSLQRKRMPDNAGLEQHEHTSLEGIALTASLNTEHRVRNLYGELTPELLLSAWMRINKDAASGVDKITAEEDQENLVGNIEN